MNFTGHILQRYSSYTNGSQLIRKNLLDEFIHELSVAFEMPHEFEPKAFMQFPVELILDYIRKTHRFYLFRKLPEMEQSIGLLLQDYHDDHPLLAILRDFYSNYRVNLSLHICEEEQHLLPYIDFLLESESMGLNPYQYFLQRQRYSLEEFEEDHHDDTEKDLEEIRTTISLHQPPPTNITPYRILQQQLYNLERDLKVHGMMEELVLLPKIRVIESELQEEFEKIFRNN